MTVDLAGQARNMEDLVARIFNTDHILVKFTVLYSHAKFTVGDGGGFSGYSGGSDFQDRPSRSAQFEEYDEFDDGGARAATRSSVPRRTPSK